MVKEIMAAGIILASGIYTQPDENTLCINIPDMREMCWEICHTSGGKFLGKLYFDMDSWGIQCMCERKKK